ncbi:MAG: helix-turn-helix domain-containing protein [Proteobacteria bacterium]|nr:helix-turn-helix domain-containing protein [Pseudomonadota bacterium]
MNRSSCARVPGEHCRAIEEALGGRITRHDLRPDVFGPAPNGSEAQHPAQQAVA